MAYCEIGYINFNLGPETVIDEDHLMLTPMWTATKATVSRFWPHEIQAHTSTRDKDDLAANCCWQDCQVRNHSAVGKTRACYRLNQMNTLMSP